MYNEGGIGSDDAAKVMKTYLTQNGSLSIRLIFINVLLVHPIVTRTKVKGANSLRRRPRPRRKHYFDVALSDASLLHSKQSTPSGLLSEKR